MQSKQDINLRRWILLSFLSFSLCFFKLQKLFDPYTTSVDVKLFCWFLGFLYSYIIHIVLPSYLTTLNLPEKVNRRSLWTWTFIFLSIISETENSLYSPVGSLSEDIRFSSTIFDYSVHPFNDDWYSGRYDDNGYKDESDSHSEDSNSESHWRNEYPDEDEDKYDDDGNESVDEYGIRQAVNNLDIGMPVWYIHKLGFYFPYFHRRRSVRRRR